MVVPAGRGPSSDRASTRPAQTYSVCGVPLLPGWRSRATAAYGCRARTSGRSPNGQGRTRSTRTRRGRTEGAPNRRSRGGLTTKNHLVCDGRGRALAFILTPGPGRRYEHAPVDPGTDSGADSIRATADKTGARDPRTRRPDRPPPQTRRNHQPDRRPRRPRRRCVRHPVDPTNGFSLATT